MALSQAQLEHIEYLIGKREHDTALPLPPIQDHGEAVFPSPDPFDYAEMTETEVAEFEESQYRHRL